MFNFLINKNYRNIDKYKNVISQIKIFGDTLSAYSDIELKQQTLKFKKMLQNGMVLLLKMIM